MSKFIENFVEWGEEFVKPFKNFIQANYSNPILMVVLFGAGVFLFFWTYDAFTKNH